ncbi:MAG: hypothetical protein R6X20_00150 [Phycisphaerae bacterium]
MDDTPPIVVPADLAQRTDIGWGAKALLALMDQVSRKTGLCWMKNDAMALRVGASRRQTIRLLRESEQRGEIAREIRSTGRPRAGAESGQAWRVLWNRPRLEPAKAPAAPTAASDLPDEGGQLALPFPNEEGCHDVTLPPRKGDRLSPPAGQDVAEKGDRLSPSSSERQYRQPVREEKRRNSRNGHDPEFPATGPACPVNDHDDGHDQGRHQDEGTTTTAPARRTRPTADPTATAAAQLQTAFAKTADGPDGWRALACLQAAGWTANQAKAARDRFGDTAIVGAVRYALHQQPPPNNPGGFIRRTLENGWHAPAQAVRQREGSS